METEFQEIQYLPELVFGILLAIALNLHLLWRRMTLRLNIIVCILLAPLLLLLLQQKTLVTERSIRVELGWIPLIQRTIPLEEVLEERVIGYVPMDGFWSVWREQRDTSFFLPRGDEGVLLKLRKEHPYFIASRRIDDLRDAIRRGKKNNGNTQ
ncbi:MAG: hypothetical protein HY695_03865 [Deltaproteobacteria bacterium]|nr:hypothetical protein [Deltaproteobacteria bacterium]